MRVVLINMPFAALETPSLSLTQLAAVLRDGDGGRIRTETLYLNIDFARYIGSPAQYAHALSGTGFMTGIGDWFFRQVAFPDADDNRDAYFARYYYADDAATAEQRRFIDTKRQGAAAFLDELIAIYRLADADVVGFTALFSQTVASFAMAERLKRVNPDIVTVIGGAACEGVMGREFAARVPQIDYVFCGPALVSFPAFLRCLLEGDEEGPARIDGVFSAVPAPAGVAPAGADLDIETPVPLDYGPFLDKLEAAFPDGSVRPCLLFETSRGCSWAETSACTFCGLNGIRRAYRSMTPHTAIETIRSLFAWVPRCPSFIAVDTMLPRGYVDTVFPFLNPPPEMKIMYEVRPDLDAADMSVLCRNGVAALQPGIESLHTATLQLMRKGTTAFRNIAFLKDAALHPLHIDWNLLVFSPGEPADAYEKYLRDLPLLMHLPPPNGVFPINIVRYSRYFEAPDAYGLDLQPQDFYALTYPFEPASLERIARHFVDRNADTETMDAWLGTLQRAVDRWRARWLGRDGKPQARLCFLEGDSGAVVYDSRSGEEREHVLTPLAARVLHALRKPAGAAELRQAFAGVAASDAHREIGRLLEGGLLFAENERYLSLVTD